VCWEVGDSAILTSSSAGRARGEADVGGTPRVPAIT
jgi:hypothetical protein